MFNNRFIKILDMKSIMFIFAFCLMAIYLFPAKDMVAGSSDALETWEVVRTFFDTNPHSSYVMYKGFLAIIPNLIFFELSRFFNLDQFFFLKLFNSIGFAYITAIGVPYFFSYLFDKKIEGYKIYVLSIIVFFAIRKNFTFISVDVPSVMVLLLTLNSAIRIKISQKKLPLIYYIYTGIITSMCALFSGQFLPAVICVILYIISTRFITLIRQKEMWVRFIAVLVCFAVGFSSVNYTNNYFIEKRVEPAREAGEWLPTGGDWLKYRLFGHGLITSKYGGSANIPDIRGKAILLRENVDISSIEKGGTVLNLKEYSRIVLKYPLDFLIRWLNKLFLGISVDDNRVSSTYLFFSYTLLFLSLYTLRNKCRMLKDLFNPKIFLILALITPSLVPSLLHVEIRYYMSIQILIAGTALLSNTFWRPFFELKELVLSKQGISLLFNETRINYSFIAYIIFISLCFMLFASLYELAGPTSDILFRR